MVQTILVFRMDLSLGNYIQQTEIKPTKKKDRELHPVNHFGERYLIL